MSDELHKAIDKAAQHLLARAGVSDKVGVDFFGDQPEPQAPLVEQVKAFEAVVDWAKVRKDIYPREEKKTESKFDAIRNKFHGAATPRRRGRATAAEADGAVSGSDEAGAFDS